MSHSQEDCAADLAAYESKGLTLRVGLSPQGEVLQRHPSAPLLGEGPRKLEDIGTILLRFEEWVPQEARRAIVSAIRQAKVPRRVLTLGVSMEDIEQGP